MIAAIYSRISTIDKQQDIMNQIVELKDYANRKNIEVKYIFKDEVSGAKGIEHRPQFRTMLNCARLKEFDVLIVWSLDRFSREGVSKTLEYIRLLDSYGVKFISIKEEFFDTSSAWRDMLIAIMAALAQQERLRLSERVKAALARRKAEGKQLGRPWDGIRKKRDEVLRLREKGFSVRTVSRLLNISKSTVQNVIKENKK